MVNVAILGFGVVGSGVAEVLDTNERHIEGKVDDLIRLGQRTYAVAPAVPVTDTVKVADLSGLVLSTPDRSTLFAVQTPQVFQANLGRLHSE